ETSNCLLLGCWILLVPPSSRKSLSPIAPAPIFKIHQLMCSSGSFPNPPSTCSVPPRYGSLWARSGDHEVLMIRPTVAQTLVRWRGVVVAGRDIDRVSKMHRENPAMPTIYHVFRWEEERKDGEMEMARRVARNIASSFWSYANVQDTVMA
ncbi:hypothetical protein Vafri_8369, partial [Volvox africanus]